MTFNSVLSKLSKKCITEQLSRLSLLHVKDPSDPKRVFLIVVDKTKAKRKQRKEQWLKNPYLFNNTKCDQLIFH